MTAVDDDFVRDLRVSIKECSDRGLFAASKWSSELLMSIPARKRKQGIYGTQTMFATSTPARAKSPAISPESPVPTQLLSQASLPQDPTRHPHAPPLMPHSARVPIDQTELLHQEQDLISSARTCMESREFIRVEPILRGCQSNKARFLSEYSCFLVSEQRVKRDWHAQNNNRHQPCVPVNASIPALLYVIQNQIQKQSDPWLLFLKALYLSRLSRREEAIECVLLSIAGFPYNWSAWCLLGSCIGDGEELSCLLPLLPLPPTHPLVQMFQIKTLNELHSPSENELGLCNRLLTQAYFPGSLWVMSLRACVLYHLHDFGRAETQFERILALDPYHVDDIDIFSNILYVTENRLRLSRLAHEFLALDKDRPEVCCLVGNHYSLRADHIKAVKYFRRATQLDRTYSAAWTLMGHEYVEMKNSHAAIEAYRTAVDVNRKDYRAWYGLGQAYELLNMHQYALHYYQNATARRPYDVRLWQAQGMCYEELGLLREAVECLKRALIPADPHEITINLKLAKIYADLNEPAEAAAYHRRVVEVCQADQRPVQDYAKSSLEVAEYQLRISDGDLSLASEYLEIVAASNAEDVGRATELLKTVRRAIGARQAKEEEERVQRSQTSTAGGATGQDDAMAVS